MEFPTLARQAVQLQLDKEMKAEELRLLYVAMTRAKDKLILVMTLPNAAKTIASLIPNAGPHPDPRTLFQRDSVGEWMLLPILARADAEELWGIQQPEHILQPADHWDIFCHRPSQLEGLEGEQKRRTHRGDAGTRPVLADLALPRPHPVPAALQGHGHPDERPPAGRRKRRRRRAPAPPGKGNSLVLGSNRLSGA